MRGCQNGYVAVCKTAHGSSTLPPRSICDLMFNINEDLAEETGIHVGDGCMNYYPRQRQNYIKYVGDLEEMNSYGKHIINLLNKIYNPNHIFISINQKNTNCYKIVLISKDILEFKRDTLHLPLGKKSKIEVPEIILNSDKLFKSFIRGFFDTDGSLWFEKRHSTYCYPKFKIENKSKKVILQCAKRLEELGFRISVSLNLKNYIDKKCFITHRLVLCGTNNLKKWNNEIGFKNSKHNTKYLVWKKYGVCPPRTKIIDRLDILKGKKNINEM